jgi:hypothetical protein
MTEANYREVSAQKAVSGDAFVQGLIDFNFSAMAPSVFIPRKSYLRVTMRVTGRDNAVLKTADCTALADNVCGGLFNNCSFKVSGQDISTINNYVAQASILKSRFGHTYAWEKSIGRSATFIESDLAKRIGRLAVDTPDRVLSRPEILPLASPNNAAATVEIKDNFSVVGVGTTFDTLLAGKEEIYLYVEGKEHQVKTVGSATALTLVNPTPAVGATTDAYFVVKTPYDADDKCTLDVLWQPPLGIFSMYDVASPEGEVLQGDFRLSLNPNSNFKYACLESTKKGLNSDTIKSGVGSECNLEILDVKFYMAYKKMYMEPTMTKQIPLSELMLLSKALYKNNTYEFAVPSSTTALAVFVQSGTANNNVNLPPSRFKLLNNAQNSLSGFQITYANTSKPSTKWISEYKNGVVEEGKTGTYGVNRLIQRYRDNLSECNLLHNTAGGESIEDYLDRGLYILYSFEKDKNDLSTQVQLSLEFAEDVEAQSNVFIAAVYDRMVEIVYQNGAVVNVRTLN